MSWLTLADVRRSFHQREYTAIVQYNDRPDEQRNLFDVVSPNGSIDALYLFEIPVDRSVSNACTETDAYPRLGIMRFIVFLSYRTVLYNMSTSSNAVLQTIILSYAVT